MAPTVAYGEASAGSELPPSIFELPGGAASEMAPTVADDGASVWSELPPSIFSELPPSACSELPPTVADPSPIQDVEEKGGQRRPTSLMWNMWTVYRGCHTPCYGTGYSKLL